MIEITAEQAEVLHQIINDHSTDVIDYESAADDMGAALFGGCGKWAGKALFKPNQPPAASFKLVRDQVPDSKIEEVLNRVRMKLYDALAKQGRGAFVSTHEISGCLDEEVIEFKEAVHSNSRDEVYKELSDVAVCAIFGMASLTDETEIDRK